MAERQWPKNFEDRLTHELPGFKEIARIMLRGGFHTWRQDPRWAESVPRIEGARLPVPSAGQATVTWVGHATWLVQMGGRLIATDPVWSERLPGQVRRLTRPGIPFEDIPRLDGFVISHNHYDHMDWGTLKRLPRDTPGFVPAAVGKWFRRRGFSEVTELDWWESADLGGVRLEFVPSHHWSRRHVDANRSLWGGWVLSSGGKKAYFAGDTAYGKWFKEIGAHHPGIDVALLPIGAYDPRWFMQAVHVNPEEAVQACQDLGAKALATMHWGTFVLTREPVGEPLERVRNAWAATGRPRGELWDVALGESRVF